ncbi:MULTISPECIES: hypothetical protein [unclassified Pseudomonas]|uniref:hypothetical protein n=1 Tax=unclassified Pseudomonas TaxID=196821 RepID=UPI00209688BF|nr:MULTISPECIES: hypothetical protein [unclassified Pseudomonas]MCO7519124.1 hypothetical protein [Pseudomonas sp. 1]MCO7540078.1 hypothetical protein [Pseudomonas sp. VA159-2]
MSCLICAGHAESITCPPGWEQRHCALCGSYRISQALVRSMMEQGQIFDAGRMRAWLVQRRALVTIPGIEPHQAILMR